MWSDSGGDINRFEIVGNVGIVKSGSTPRGLPITNLSVGTHRAVLNPDTHQREERTDWHDVVLFGALASTVAHTIAKGARVYASGYMRKRSWESATSGKKAYRYELVATVLEMRAAQRHRAIDEPPPPRIPGLEIHRI